MVEHMICHKIADPNIRLQGGAYAKVGTMTYSQGDARVIWPRKSRMTVTILLAEKWLRAMRKSFLAGQADAMVAPTTARDSGPEKKQDAFQELNSLDRSWKSNMIKKMINMVEFNKKRIASGKAPENKPACCLYGNPGAGKLIVARLLGKVLLMGVLSEGKNLPRGSNGVRSDLFKYWGNYWIDPSLAWKARGASFYWWSL